MALYSMVSSWARSARERPDEPAVTLGDRPSVTWKELHKTSNQLARVYAERGVRWGDIVTISLPTSIEAVQALLAIVKLGATPSPISAQLPETELRPLLELAKPRIVVAVPGSYPADIPTIGPDVDLADYSDADLPELISPSFKAPTSGGSTGRPKLIMAGSPAVMNDGPDTPIAQLGLPIDGCMLSAGPLYHNTAVTLILAGLSLRNHVVLEPRFDAELTLRLIERHRVAFTLLVPTMMNRIWRLPQEVRDRYDLSSLRVLAHNAAPCPPELKRAFINWLGPDRVFENYTATEQSAQTSVSGSEWLERPGTVGRAMVGEFCIRDDNGADCPPGEVGMIHMRRPVGSARTFHYLGEPDSELEGGWHSVGDLGYMDKDGYLFLSDRRTDLIISGGANIYPAEVEGVLGAHPDVLDCVVVGVADDDLGQRAHAIVQPSKTDLTDEELDAFMRQRLTRYKCPRTYEFVGEAIRNEAGKVRRSALAAARSGVNDTGVETGVSK